MRYIITKFTLLNHILYIYAQIYSYVIQYTITILHPKSRLDQ